MLSASLVPDEVHLWLALGSCRWSGDLHVTLGLALLQEDVHQVLVLVLLRKNDFSLRGGVLRGRLHEDDVDVLVSTWNADHLVLPGGWLIRSRVHVHLQLAISKREIVQSLLRLGA
jgi:hypothetical protein